MFFFSFLTYTGNLWDDFMGIMENEAAGQYLLLNP